MKYHILNISELYLILFGINLILSELFSNWCKLIWQTLKYKYLSLNWKLVKSVFEIVLKLNWLIPNHKWWDLKMKLKNWYINREFGNINEDFWYKSGKGVDKESHNCESRLHCLLGRGKSSSGDHWLIDQSHSDVLTAEINAPAVYCRDRVSGAFFWEGVNKRYIIRFYNLDEYKVCKD